MNRMKLIKRITMSAAMGLGLGIGLAVTMLPARTTVQAHPEKVAVYAVAPTTMIFERLDVTKSIGDGKEVTKANDVGLGDTRALQLAGSNEVYKVLTQLNLGDEITFMGDNNGVYRYTVTQVFETGRGQSEQFGSDVHSQVVVSAHEFPWSATELAVILSYRQ